MNPYRKAAARVRVTLDRHPRWLAFPDWVVGMVILVLVGVFAWWAATHTQSPPDSPCSSYANFPMRDVPARCLKEFSK